MTDRLTGIEERLKDGTAYRPTPHRPVVNTAGDRHGVVDSSGCVVDMDSPAAARFYAAAPTDISALLNAANAALELHRSVQVFFPDYVDGYYECDQCMEAYPCPTVTAINAALEGK